MNINDNRLNELMNKTTRLAFKKERRRKMILTASLGTFSIALAVVALSIFLNLRQVPDVTVDSSFLVASENAATPTPMPDGATWDPNGGPTPEFFSVNTWEDWTKTEIVDDVRITVNTNIIHRTLLSPDTLLFTYQIAPMLFDLDIAQKAVEYFLGNEYYKHKQTKGDYDLEIQTVQNSMENLDLSEKENEEVLWYISQLEGLKRNAPQENVKGKIEFEAFEHDGVKLSESIALKGYTENAIPHVNIVNYLDNDWNGLNYNRGDLDRNYIWTQRAFDNSVGILEQEVEEMSKASALAYDAVEYFTDDMECEYALKGYVYDGSTELSSIEDHIDYETAPTCYVFYFTKKYDTLCATLDLSPLPYSKDVAVAMPEVYPDRFNNEYIKVIVDDKGIAQFGWNNKTQTIKVDAKDVDIISYDDVKNIFEEKIFELYIDVPDISKTEINLSSVSIEMTRIENEDGKWMMVPTYTIKGTQTSTTSYGREVIHGKDTDNKNILIINALDGSIID